MPPLRALAEASSRHQSCERHHDRQFAVANRDAAFCESKRGGNGLGRHRRIKRHLDPSALRLVRRRVPVLRSEEMNEVVVHFTCKLLNSDNAILIGFPGKPLERLSCPLTLNQRVPGSSPGAHPKPAVNCPLAERPFLRPFLACGGLRFPVSARRHRLQAPFGAPVSGGKNPVPNSTWRESA